MKILVINLKCRIKARLLSLISITGTLIYYFDWKQFSILSQEVRMVMTGDKLQGWKIKTKSGVGLW